MGVLAVFCETPRAEPCNPQTPQLCGVSRDVAPGLNPATPFSSLTWAYLATAGFAGCGSRAHPGPFLDAPGADLGVLVLLAAQHVGAAVPADLAGEQLAEGLDADHWPRPSVRNSPSHRSQGRPAASVAMLAERADRCWSASCRRGSCATGRRTPSTPRAHVDARTASASPEPGYAVMGQEPATRLAQGVNYVVVGRGAGVPRSRRRNQGPVGDQDQEVPEHLALVGGHEGSTGDADVEEAGALLGRGMSGFRPTRTDRVSMSPPRRRLLPVAVHTRSLANVAVTFLPAIGGAVYCPVLRYDVLLTRSVLRDDPPRRAATGAPRARGPRPVAADRTDQGQRGRDQRLHRGGGAPVRAVRA